MPKKNPYKPIKPKMSKPKKRPGAKADKKSTKKKEIPKGRKKTAAALKAFGKSMSKADPMSAVTDAERVAALGAPSVGAMKKASDSEFRSAKKKLRANKLKNDKEYRKNN